MNKMFYQILKKNLVEKIKDFVKISKKKLRKKTVNQYKIKFTYWHIKT